MATAGAIPAAVFVSGRARCRASPNPNKGALENESHRGPPRLAQRLTADLADRADASGRGNLAGNVPESRGTSCR